MFDVSGLVPNRLAILLRTTWSLLAILLLTNPSAAEVAVLSNRTTRPVKCTLTEIGARANVMTIAPGDSRPAFFNRSLRIRYSDGRQTREYDLAPANAYFFTHWTGGSYAPPGKNRSWRRRLRFQHP